MASLIVNSGRAIASAALVAATNPPKFGMWGTGSGQGATATGIAAAAAPTTTTAVTGTITQVTVTTTNDAVQVVFTVTAAGTLSITEAGLTTNATIASGTLFYYTDFTAQPVLAGDTLTFTFKFPFS